MPKNINASSSTPEPLSPEQLQAARLLLTGLTHIETAKKCGIARSTLYQWCRSAGFQAYIEERKAELETNFRERLTSLVSSALDWMETVMQSPDTKPALRTRVALAILQRQNAGPKAWNVPGFTLHAIKSLQQVRESKAPASPAPDKIEHFSKIKAPRRQQAPTEPIGAKSNLVNPLKQLAEALPGVTLG